MIISASRRTDIPAFYAPWFMNRLRAGYAIARNPMNPAQARRVSLAPGDVDACVFWSKDFRPMLEHLAEVNAAFPVCVQHTLTPYGARLEPGVSDKREIIDGMLRISDAIGPQRLVWRYDPIIFSPEMTVEWHLAAFSRACDLLSGATRVCVFSFLQLYPKILGAMRGLYVVPSEQRKRELARGMAEIAKSRGIALKTCAQEIDLTELGISRGACIGPELIFAATGRMPKPERDSGQRGLCRCLKSVDIGAYHTCPHLCAYCYANWGARAVARNFARHSPEAEEI